MDVSTPPSLDLACPQTEADIEKYGHEGMLIILIIATY